jgi:hypothetical protein
VLALAREFCSCRSLGWMGGIRHVKDDSTTMQYALETVYMMTAQWSDRTRQVPGQASD